MKSKNPKLDGISYGGIPLKPENLPLCDETLESIEEDQQYMRKCKKRIKPKYIKGTGRRGKRGPVRLLSRDEVNDYTFKRKIQMAEKKRSERTMRALAFLFDETYRTGKWIGTEDVAKHLDIPRSSTSGLLTIISKKMHDSVELKLDNKKILRQMKDDCPFSSAREFVEEYYRRSGKKGKRRVKVRPPKPIEPKPVEPKPTKTRDAMQRALRFIFAKGKEKGDDRWVESKDVAEALSITFRSASGLVSRIGSRMSDLLVIENIGVGKQKKFRLKTNVNFLHQFKTTEEFVEEFYKRGPKFDKKVVELIEVPPEVPPEIEPEVKPDDEVDEIDLKLTELEKEVREGIEKVAKGAADALAEILNAVDKRIDLNLNVTGEVKFRFLLGEKTST
jgi:hypothetical protein